MGNVDLLSKLDLVSDNDKVIVRHLKLKRRKIWQKLTSNARKSNTQLAMSPPGETMNMFVRFSGFDNPADNGFMWYRLDLTGVKRSERKDFVSSVVGAFWAANNPIGPISSEIF